MKALVTAVLAALLLASPAAAAVNYEPAPAHECSAVLQRVGSPPVSVPCDPPPSPEVVTPAASPSPQTVMPAAAVSRRHHHRRRHTRLSTARVAR